jgi:hypothetical protein
MGPNDYYFESGLQNQRGGPSADLLPHPEKEQGRRTRINQESHAVLLSLKLSPFPPSSASTAIMPVSLFTLSLSSVCVAGRGFACII